MATFLLSAFLILFGVMNLIATDIPKWVLGLLAVFAGLALLFGRFSSNPNMK